uniref:Uncharacterized protein n=1 Tax=Trichogramma kaykai TaxID=54128 RepID=A0ABD2X0B8_9HYME
MTSVPQRSIYASAIRGLERQKPDIFDLVERHQSLRNTRARGLISQEKTLAYTGLALVEQNYLKAAPAANTDQKSKIQDFGTPVYSKLVRITRASLHLILFSLARGELKVTSTRLNRRHFSRRGKVNSFTIECHIPCS